MSTDYAELVETASNVSNVLGTVSLGLVFVFLLVGGGTVLGVMTVFDTYQPAEKRVGAGIGVLVGITVLTAYCVWWGETRIEAHNATTAVYERIDSDLAERYDFIRLSRITDQGEVEAGLGSSLAWMEAALDVNLFDGSEVTVELPDGNVTEFNVKIVDNQPTAQPLPGRGTLDQINTITRHPN